MLVVGRTAVPASQDTGIWGYGSRLGGRDDIQCVDANFQTASRAHFRDLATPRVRSFAGISRAFKSKRAQGMPDARRTRSLACNKEKTHAHSQVHRKHAGIPCATVLTAPPWSPRRTGLFSHRRRRDRSRRLDTSVGVPGLHGFAARKRAARPAAPFRPSHPAPRSLTVASRPSYRDGTRKGIILIYRN
jgi:hypothetical protein